MSKKACRYIYGPVPSWRLGSSLGIDPISNKEKICSFDCPYCQLGKTKHLSKERKTFVPTDKIIEEITPLLSSLKIDYITLSGTGEPTLARNLGEIIMALREITKKKIAILTNSSLMEDPDVRSDLALADLVIAKLDAGSEEIFLKVSRPLSGIRFNAVAGALKEFRRSYKGKLALQMMFTDENREDAARMARIVMEIGPDEVQINTPLRPCAVKPLSKKDLDEIMSIFVQECGSKTAIVNVYDIKKKDVEPVSRRDTLRRRRKV